MPGLLDIVNLKTSFTSFPSSAFQSKSQPFFFVICFKSGFVNRKTSVAKLSPGDSILNRIRQLIYNKIEMYFFSCSHNVNLLNFTLLLAFKRHPFYLKGMSCHPFFNCSRK